MVEDFNVSLAGRIASARKLAGKTQQQIADELAIHVNQYQRLEAGKHRVSVYDLTRIASVIGVTAGDLLDPPPETNVMGQTLTEPAANAMPLTAQPDLPALTSSGSLDGEALDPQRAGMIAGIRLDSVDAGDQPNEHDSGKMFEKTSFANTSPQTNLIGRWLPVEQADKSVERVIDLPDLGLKLTNSENYWMRDADGRTFHATWADDGKRAYWWDFDSESPVDPVEFMPHPLDPRWAALATTEASE